MDTELVNTAVNSVNKGNWLISRLKRQRKRATKTRTKVKVLQAANEKLQQDIKAKDEEIRKLKEAADDVRRAQLTRLTQLEQENASLHRDHEELKLAKEATGKEKQAQIDNLKENIGQLSQAEAAAREKHEQFTELTFDLSGKCIAMELQLEDLEKGKGVYKSKQIKEALAREKELSSMLSDKQLALDQANEELEDLAQALDTSEQKNRALKLPLKKESTWRMLVRRIRAVLSLPGSGKENVAQGGPENEEQNKENVDSNAQTGTVNNDQEVTSNETGNG